MKIQKLGGSLAVAISLFALSGIAQADSPYFNCPDGLNHDGTDIGPEFSRENVAYAIEDMAYALACAGYTPRKGEPVDGSWDKDDPIWQWGKNDGCEVHYKLSKTLYVPRDPDSPPPKVDKGSNLAQGAANDVRDGKDATALEQLTYFMENLMYSANAVAGHQGDEDDFLASAVAAYNCVSSLGANGL